MTPIDRGDTASMLICSALVLFMTPGLAFFYGGLVRSKNVVNTMMMSFVAMGVFATTAVNSAGADGLLSGNISLFGIQALAVIVTVAFSAIMTWLILSGLDKVIGIRSADDEEREGLDFVEHGERGYHELI